MTDYSPNTERGQITRDISIVAGPEFMASLAQLRSAGVHTSFAQRIDTLANTGEVLGR